MVVLLYGFHVVVITYSLYVTQTDALYVSVMFSYLTTVFLT